MDNEEKKDINDAEILVQIIDDDKIIRSMLTKVLEKSGYRIISSDNGKSGIEQYIHEKPDLILLDVLMPDMNGYEVCAELRKPEYDKSLPILMLTGLDDVASVNEAFSVGATDFVTKPINLALLGERVKYALKGKEMYHEIQRKTNELDAIFSSASDGIVTTDLKNHILDLNPAATALFSSDKTTLVGMNLNQLIDESEISDIACGIELQATGKRIGGDSFPLEYTVNIVSLGDISFKSYFIRDLTERLKIERMKGEFIQTVSHELRTPIAAIKGAVGILGSGVLGDLPEDVMELINIPRKACGNLENLVDDMLDVTTLEDSVEALEYENIGVDDLFSKVVSKYKEAAYDKNIEVIIEYNPGMSLYTDLNIVSKAVGHLLSNAIKFSAKGEKVVLSPEIDGQTIKIRISDNGIGIENDNKVKIFEKFFQIDNSSTRQQGGTGLGLYITKMTVEKLKGKIQVESALDAGSTFTILLPNS